MFVLLVSEICVQLQTPGQYSAILPEQSKKINLVLVVVYNV